MRTRHDLTKTVTIATAILTMVCIVSSAETMSSQSKRNEISIDLFNPAINLVVTSGSVVTFEMSYQRLLTDHFALSVVPRIDLCPTDYRIAGWIGVDWHPFNVGLGGLLIGPAAYAEYYSQYTAEEPISTVGLGVSLGYRFITKWGLDITVELIGLGYGLRCSEGVVIGSTMIFGQGVFVGLVF